MWKLFPPGWFKRTADTKPRGDQSAADHVQRRWRELLAAALFGGLRESHEPTAVVDRLLQLSDEQLLLVDEAFRRGWRSGEDILPSPRVAGQLTTIQSSPRDVQAFLFVASCYPYGFIREQAMRALQDHRGPLAMPIALIRCGDWVAQVRAAAVDAFNGLAWTGPQSELFVHLDLLLRLRGRQCFQSEVWDRAIEPKLLAPEAAEARWRATKREPASVRLFAYQLVSRADPERKTDLVAEALADHDVTVASWALRSINVLEGPEIATALAPALEHHFASVRASAIRIVADRDLGDVRGTLQSALFDRARAPRAAAAFELGHRFGVPAIDFWRDAIGSSDDQRRIIATIALSDVAQAADAPIFERMLLHPRVTVRVAALRGLWRAGAANFGIHLRAALSDPTKRVVRQAIELYARSNEVLVREDLEGALRNRPSEHVAMFLVHSGKRLDKWEALYFFLTLAHDRNTSLASSAVEELRTWVAHANRRFTRPPPDMAAKLAGLLRSVSAGRTDQFWRELEAIAQHQL